MLIHGAGDVGWYWHLVDAALRERGHDVVTMDLPVDDGSAGLSTYADVVVTAIGDRSDLVVVAQSFGGYIAPIVCHRVPVKLLVLVAGMVPTPGETAEEMFANTGYEQEKQEDPQRSRGLLPRCSATLGCRGDEKGTHPVEHAGEGALAAGRVAGRSDSLPALSERPTLSARVGTSGRSEPARYHAGRNRQRPLPRP